MISESPGFLGNGPICAVEDEDCDTNYAETNVIVGMTGQLPVKVSSENGEIAIGDPITVGDTNGVGVKATEPGQIVGYAMEAFNGSETGTIKVYINPGYSGPSMSDMVQGQDSDFNTLSASTANIEQLNAIDATITSLTVEGIATIAELEVTGVATFEGNITVEGHFIVAGDEPVVEALSTAGTNSEASINGNDTAGTLTIQTGDNPTTGDLLKLIFNSQYGNPPKFIFSPANAEGAGLDIFRGETTGDYTILRSSSDPEPNTTYKFDYFIIQAD